MRRICRTTLLLLALATLASAVAAENPFYLTGKLSDTTLDGDLGASVDRILDGSDVGWSLGLGFKLGKYLAFQLEYYDLGSASVAAFDTSFGVDSTAASLTVLPHLPFGERFALYGKLGFVSWESDVSELVDSADRFTTRLDDEDLIYGAGLRFELPIPFAIGVFAEYEILAEDFESFSLGATWGF